MHEQAHTLEAARDAVRRFAQQSSPEAANEVTVLEDAKRAYASTMRAYGAAGIRPEDYLGPIWANNLELHLIPNIERCQTAGQAIAYLNDKAFYDFSCGEPYLTPSIEWRLDFLRSRHGVEIDALPPELCESPLVLRKHCLQAGGRLLSSDFLNRLAWVFRLERALAFPQQQPFSILEIGGGFGALARVFKLRHRRAQIVLVDIPESLFFQHVFLKASFPEARHQYISGPDDVVGDADFVYVPNGFSGVLEDKAFFLAVNTNSFGEMPERASSGWLDLIQTQTETQHIFFLNRFLNRIDRDLVETRQGHSSWSFLLDDRWTMQEWEVDPDYERCPYFQTTLTRNLHIIATRGAPTRDEEAALLRRADRIAMEDWCRRPGWDDFKFVSGADYPPLMSRGDLDLAPDLCKTGTLYTLWALVRLTRQPHWIELLLNYLDYLNGQQAERFFEEIPTLMLKLPAQH